MSDEPQGPGAPADEDPETGRPVEVLHDLGQQPSPGFIERLRLKLQRRTLTGQIAVLSWQLPKMLLLEFLDLVFHLFGSGQAARRR